MQYDPQYTDPYRQNYAPDAGERRFSRGAIWAFVLGLAGFSFGLLTGIPAIIIGHKSRSSIRNSGGMLLGGPMALTGLILGYVTTFVMTGVWVLYIWLIVEQMQHGYYYY